MLPQGIPRDPGQHKGWNAIAMCQLHLYLKAPDLLQKLSQNHTGEKKHSSSRQALSGVQGIPSLG